MDMLIATGTPLLLLGAAVYFAVCAVAFAGHVLTRPRNGHRNPGVSILIPARNEERNLPLLLDDLLAQTYPADLIDITVIDDESTDGTRAVADRYAARHDRITVTETRTSPSPFTHKKKAVHQGILQSTGEVIVTVDGDCRMSSRWLSGLMRHFDDDINLVAGEVMVHEGGAIGALEALEFTGIQMVASGLANTGFPVTCNGANLAYRRSAFEAVGGFKGVGDVVSGDDDLVLQKIARRFPGSAVFATDPDTVVHVEAVHDLKGFVEKRTRWASKIFRYPAKSAIALLAGIYGFLCLLVFWPLVAAGQNGVSFLPWCAALGLKTAGDLLCAGWGVIKYGRAGLLAWFPLAEFLHTPYIIGISLRGYFGTFDWRGRKARAVSTACRELPHD